MPIFRRPIDRKLNDAADKVIKELEAEEKDEHGSGLMAWILMQIVLIIAKKLLERIISNDGREVVNMARSALNSIESERKSMFGETKDA